MLNIILRVVLHLTMNLRCDNSFVQDEGWYKAANRYEDFIRRHSNSHILFLELGVGMNTPVIIKYPFWQMTVQKPNAVYACVNLRESYCPNEIAVQSICLQGDIGNILHTITNKRNIICFLHIIVSAVYPPILTATS